MQIADEGRDAPNAAAARRTLVLLTLVYVLGYADRSIINLLLDPIKLEYRLTDTMMGLITGLGFTAFQTILGIPVARWADNTKRVTILAGGLLLWSVMTGLSGLVTSAILLTLARMGVGVGEACLTGPSHSLLSSAYQGARRPRAFSMMAAGGEIGVILALAVGGWINHYWGWRAAFLVAGAPGIILSIIVFKTMEERPRPATEKAKVKQPLGQALRQLAIQPSFVIAIVASMAMGLNIFGLQVWSPTYLRRIYGLDLASIGLTIAALRAVLSVSGALIGGALTSWCTARYGTKWLMLTPGIFCACSGIGLAAFLFAPSLAVAIALLGVTNMFVAAQLGPVFSLVQSVAPVRSRALAAGLFVSLTQLFGMGIGSVLIGLASDALHGAHGAASLRLAMLIPVSGAIVSGFIYIVGARYVPADIKRLETDSEN